MTFVKQNAKAIAAFVSAGAYFVLTDGGDANEFQEAAKTLAIAFVVWVIPNRG